MKYGLFLSVIILFQIGRTLAQTGTVAGIVKDTLGKPVPGALVVLDDDKFSTKTDSLGRYMVLHVPRGTYQLFVWKAWFMPRIVRELRVESDQTVFIAVTLSTFDDNDVDKRFRMPLFIPDSSIHYR